MSIYMLSSYRYQAHKKHSILILVCASIYRSIHLTSSLIVAFSVTRSSRGLVSPCEPTPSGTLNLSVIDRLPFLRFNVRTLHVFRHGVEAARVIKEALSRALVPYYPLAGRLKESSQGELQIACTADGVWFVEASADSTLAAVDYFDNTDIIPYDELLADHVPEMEAQDPLVIMQVTRFTCDGFVIGLITCHSICDGLGAAQFLNAVGEMARGHKNLSIAPVWNRDFFPPPKQPNPNSLLFPNLPPPVSDYRLEHAKFDISVNHINQLKREFQDLTGQTCSSFEIVVATLWSCRTRAINFMKNTELKLFFSANCRQLVKPPLPEGFYGNCYYPVTVTASSDFLSQASNADVVKLIQDAKALLPNEFVKWVNGENGADPFAPPLSYYTLVISEWRRLGFSNVDYGWGSPVHIVPIQVATVMPTGIVGSLPSPKKGIRLVTWCVENTHLQPLLHQMEKVI